MTIIKNDVNKVAVYGSLREGLHNYRVVSRSKKLGMFESLPQYSMYSVAGNFPALIDKGSTSIVMEVYEIDEKTLNSLDNLEGYISPGHTSNHYNRDIIDTPYGKAYIYFYSGKTAHMAKVINGDWKSFKDLYDRINP